MWNLWWLISMIKIAASIGLIIGPLVAFLFFLRSRHEQDPIAKKKLRHRALWIILSPLLCLWILVRVPMSGSNPPAPSITGTLLWEGKPAKGMLVKLCIYTESPGYSGLQKSGDKDKCPSFEQNTVTDDSGKYQFSNIPFSKDAPFPLGFFSIFSKWPSDERWAYAIEKIGEKEFLSGKIDPIDMSHQARF